MQYTVALLALAASVAAQTPPGCSEDFSGTFEISPVNATGSTKRDILEARQARQACTNTPVVTLKGGILIDQSNRQGEIVANQQFQFDDILQPDALFTTGFSICANGSLAIGGSAIFWSCRSGEFSNLYHETQGEQCSTIFIDTQPCEGGSAAQSAALGSYATSSSSSSTSSTSTSSTSTSSTSASSTSTSSTSTSSTSTTPTTTATPTPSTTSSTTPVTTASSTPTIVAPIPVSTSATIIPPFPSGNSTTVSATATGSAPVTTSSVAATTSSVPFDSGANVLAMGGSVIAAVAGLAAFALF